VEIVGSTAEILGEKSKELDSTPATTRVAQLRLGNIGSAARHFTGVIDPGHLRSLDLHWCIELPVILEPLMQKKKHS
jgi:hypothetical protein